MSVGRKEIIQCPECKTKGEFTKWIYIDVEHNPELKMKLFKDELFCWKCPVCGHQELLPYSLLYYDKDNNFLLEFSFLDDDSELSRIDIPAIDSINEDTIIRRVVGLGKFREKIVILDKGYNDVAIEHMKYMITHIVNPELFENGARLEFCIANYNCKDLSEDDTIEFILIFDEDNYSLVEYPMTMYYEHCLKCKLDPRFKISGYVNNVDQTWISKHIKYDLI